MAQLKVKQISDFVSAVEAKVNGIVGTANVSAISVAKSEAISSSVSADVVVLSSAKSYADQAETDAVATASADATTKASTAESKAISTAVSADVVVLSSAKSYADEAEADALSNAKVYADSKDALVLKDAKDYSDIQKGRIDALLNDSNSTLDTFKEIETFITSLETGDVAGLSAALSTAVSNDAVHATGISDNAEAIGNLDTAAQGYADTAESNAISTAVSADVVVLSSAKSYADVAEADAISSANGYTGLINAVGTAAYNATGDFATAEQGALADSALQDADAFDAAGSAAAALVSAKTYADTAESDAITSANGYTDTEIGKLDTTLRGVIDGVAGTDKVEQIAVFASPAEFSVTNRLSLDNNDILVFVNGLQIHRASEVIDGFTTGDGQAFTVSGLGYDLEESDHIVVVGVAA